MPNVTPPRVSRHRAFYIARIGTILSPIRDLLGDADIPGTRPWAIGSLIDAVGSGAIRPLTVLYFTIHVGLSTGSVGLGLTLGALISLAFAPLAGIAIDRVGPRTVLAWTMGLGALAFAAFVPVRLWAEMLVVVTAAEVVQVTSRTARQSLVAEVASGESRMRLQAAQRALRNLGYGVGGLLSSVALALGGVAFPIVAGANAVSYVAAVWFVVALPASFGGRRPALSARPRATEGLRRVLRDRRYLSFAGLDTLASFHATALEVALPLWVVLHTHAPRAMAGILFTLNTAIVVLAQVRTTQGFSRLADAPRAYRRAATAIVVCAAAYLAARYVSEPLAIALLCVGCAANTACEMLVSAGEWTAGIDLADPHHRGSYLSIYTLGNGLGDAVGPTIVTGILVLGAVWLWPAVAVIVCVGALASAALVARAVTDPRPPPEDAAAVAADPTTRQTA